MPCKGPDCIAESTPTQPPANQPKELLQIDITELLKLAADDKQKLAKSFSLLLLAAQAHSNARLFAEHDGVLSRKLDTLASVFGEAAVAAGLAGAADGKAAVQARTANIFS